MATAFPHRAGIVTFGGTASQKIKRTAAKAKEAIESTP
jgi:hypothetical protein